MVKKSSLSMMLRSQRHICGQILEKLGYSVHTAASGEEAVEYLKHNNVDLVLLDMLMDPGINGLETYERIIKIHPHQKAVLISGYAATDEVKRAQGLGAGALIKKTGNNKEPWNCGKRRVGKKIRFACLFIFH